MGLLNDFESAKSFFLNKKCTIVARGSSLTRLRKKDIDPESTIITINNACVYVDRLDLNNLIFGCQRDVNWTFSCPKSNKIFLDRPVIHSYPTAEKYIFLRHILLKNAPNKFTAHCAVAIAHLLGASEIVMMCFDSVNNDFTYAPGLIPKSANNVTPVSSREKLHKQFYRDVMSKYPNISWKFPV